MRYEDQDAIEALSRELVRQVAPAELALHASMTKAYFDGKTPGRRRRGDDELLGFGVGEAVVFLAPIVIEFSRQFWEALSQQSADATAGFLVALVKRVRRRFSADSVPAVENEGRPPVFTTEELRYVREVGRRCAENLPLTPSQQVLLVESLVGSLAAPDVAGSTSPRL